MLLQSSRLLSRTPTKSNVTRSFIHTLLVNQPRFAIQIKNLNSTSSKMSTSTTNTSSAAAAEAQHQKDITSWAGKDGEFKRLPSTFRTTELGGDHPVEKGRYVLYVSLACPWAHRTMIVRELKGLHEYIDLSIVHPHMGALGWSFYPPIRKFCYFSTLVVSFSVLTILVFFGFRW